MIATCEFCGTEYTTFKNWYNRTKHHTCSRLCADSLKKKLSTKTCKHCGKSFYSVNHQKDKLYCSSKCAREASMKRLNIVCQICNKEYTIVESRATISKFCSDSCRVKYTGHLASLRVGELNSQYKGFNTGKRSDKSKLKSWAYLVKRRDKICKFCKSEDNLQAHHIKSYKDHREIRFDLENGILLCGTCHSLQHKNDSKLVSHLITKRNGNRQKVDSESC